MKTILQLILFLFGLTFDVMAQQVIPMQDEGGPAISACLPDRDKAKETIMLAFAERGIAAFAMKWR